jgi:acetyl esterase
MASMAFERLSLAPSLAFPRHTNRWTKPKHQELDHPMNRLSKLAAFTLGASLMTQVAVAAPDAATDPRIDPQIRSFLAQINKDSSPFWELPQPKPQEILTGLQSQTAVDMSGVTTTETTITQDGRSVKLHIMKPEHVSGKPGVLLFIHGGVWIVGNFQNHQRLLRDLVVGSGQVGVFVEYTPLPAARSVGFRARRRVRRRR